MSDDMAADFALAAVREDGVWSVVPMPPAAADDLDQIIHALHQQPGDAGAVGLVSFEEDFFVILRCVGDDVRMLLSDVTAAFDAPFAGQVLDRLGGAVVSSRSRRTSSSSFAVSVTTCGYCSAT